MDGQTDRQGQILMPPDYRHGGIKTHITKSRWFQIHLRVNLMNFKLDESKYMLMASVSDEGGNRIK